MDIKSPNTEKYHFWLGCKTGYVFATNRDFVPRGQKGERFKYVGYTIGWSGWPKKMSTGRILYMQNKKAFKKQRKLRKLSERLKN